LGNIAFALATLLYAAASTVFYVEVARPKGKRGDRRALAPVLLGIAACMHFVHIVAASFVAHVCPVRSAQFVLSLTLIFATAVYLIARRRYRIHALGLVVAPTGLVLVLATFFLSAGGTASKLPPSFIGLHVFANLMGDALFLLASGAAVMYLFQERRLKSKRSPMLGAGAMPALDSLDRAMHRFLVAGFPLLTLGAATGAAWASKLDTGAPGETLRAVFGYATWLLAGSVLLLRVAAGWRGRRAAYGTVAGFTFAVAVLLIYLLRPLAGGGGALGG